MPAHAHHEVSVMLWTLLFHLPTAHRNEYIIFLCVEKGWLGGLQQNKKHVSKHESGPMAYSASET